MIFFLFKSPASSRSKEQLTLNEMVLLMDLPGALIALAAVLCYVLALQRGGIAEPWNSPHVYGTLIGFGLLFVLFISVEWWQGHRAMCATYLLKRRLIWVGCVYSFL